MKIVYYEETHLQACAKRLVKHYNSADFGCKFTEQQAALYLQELIFAPRFVGFVLLEKNTVIGFCFCQLRTWSDSEEMHINEFILEEAHQRKGIGSKLLDFVSTYAASYQLKGITTSTNVIALTEFYQKNDFLSHDISFLYKGIPQKA